MLFSSLTFTLLFLPIVFLCAYLVSVRWQWVLLLLASLVFYAALRVPYLLVVLAVVSAVTWWLAFAIKRAEDAFKKKNLLILGVAGNISTLLILKYLPFLQQNLQGLFDFGAKYDLIFVSIGVSYYIFQSISYLVDVYLDIEEPEPHLGYFLLYMAFFPKLLQGPIERAGNLIPQLKKPCAFNYENARTGLFLFGWGLFKKMVIADRLALYVDPVYGSINEQSGFVLLLATYAYAFQLYFDFSGYTDMALGIAKLFGINLTQNFNSPYMARDIGDFWRRWHISFSRWVLDYIFKPLQMHWRDWRNAGTALALLITFLISGLWHGASWNFVVWGGLQGIFLASGVYYKPYKKKLHNRLGSGKSTLLHIWQIFFTFNLVCLSWIFFRTENLNDGWQVLAKLGTPSRLFEIKKFLNSDGPVGLAILSVAFAAVALSYWLKNRHPEEMSIHTCPAWIRWCGAYAIFFAIIFFSADSSKFIYLQF